jgi:Ca2+-binding EF-hand superfamily protein
VDVIMMLLMCRIALALILHPLRTSFAPQFVHLLFIEIDQDGSGTIDKGEFRMMLRKLNLTYRYHYDDARSY